MRRVLWLSLAGLLLFILFVVARIPAEQLTSRLPPVIQVQGPSGTIWSGRARQISWRNSPLGQFSWDWRPVALFSGKLAFAIEVTAQGRHLQAVIAQDSGDGQTLSDVRLQLEARQLQPWLPVQDALPEGHIELTIPFLGISGGWPRSGEGKLLWRDAELAGSLPMRLGTLTADILVQDTRISAVIADMGGPLEINGTAELDPDRVYRFNARLRTRSEADDNLRTALSLLGSPDVSGRYSVTHGARF